MLGSHASLSVCLSVCTSSEAFVHHRIRIKGHLCTVGCIVHHFMEFTKVFHKRWFTISSKKWAHKYLKNGIKMVPNSQMASEKWGLGSQCRPWVHKGQIGPWYIIPPMCLCLSLLGTYCSLRKNTAVTCRLSSLPTSSCIFMGITYFTGLSVRAGGGGILPPVGVWCAWLCDWDESRN